MKIFRFWQKLQRIEQIKDRSYDLIAWGGSFISDQDAGFQAEQRLRDIKDRLSSPQEDWDYGYSQRDIRECIIDEKYDNQGQKWVITRNRYGALVLNSAKVMFVDIDHVPSGCLGIGGSKKEALLPGIRDCVDQHKLNCHIYETFAGYRLLIMNKTFDADGSEAQEILKNFKSDKLYTQLCKTQDCYRARLTPKPYRINVATPNISVTNIKEAEQQSWIENYENQSSNYAVCWHLEQYGSDDSLEEAEEVRALHDKYCLNRDRDLA